MTTPPDYAPPIAITLGDAAGIGPEIIVKLCHAGLPFPCVVYGDAGILSATVKRLGLQGQIRIAAVAGPDDAVADDTVISVVNRWQPLPADLPPGRIDARAGRAAYEYLCQAIDDAATGRLRAIVTAPLNKEAMRAGGRSEEHTSELPSLMRISYA